MTLQEYEIKKRSIEAKKETRLMRRKLRELKKLPKQKMECYKKMSLILMAFFGAIIILLVADVQISLFWLKDTMPLNSLITAISVAVLGELGALMAYCAKSYLSKKEEERINLEKEKMNKEE